ncbi:MAG: hypothetical protein DWQ29_22530 [Planctomycetota bacterium]|nr:MAG: hypothetical protein DWQ29_22530 [Planctomycetota bacterium]
MKPHRLSPIVLAPAAFLMLGASLCRAELRAGAVVVDVTPRNLPVLVNGSMVSRSADQVKTPINARAIALDDGSERIAIVVVDSCMMPRPLLDEVKKLAADRVGIAADRILIAATHTHSAPSSMACLGTNADPEYVPFLRGKLVEAIEAAAANLEPARVGWASIDAAEYTALRRWIRRPDRIEEDPFGNPTVRANMHAGRNWDDVIGESGPEDPELSLISLQSIDGRPIAVLANFSMHYFGDQALSADYFGLFSNGLRHELSPETIDGVPPFVGMMSHGCSGDIWRRDYTQPIPSAEEDFTIETYANGLLGLAIEAYHGIEYDSDADLSMAEARIPLNYRVPDKQRLEWAQRVAAEIGDRLPETATEVYALEQMILHERESTEVVVQALRIGDMAIATTPTETYALTGLKIKAHSPLEQTMVLDLTNGGDGYIPPPEQHRLGGYNTWPARSAGLEVQAEPKITETAIQLLERVTGTPRRAARQSRGPGAEAVLALKPVAYWRMDEMAAPWAADSSGHHREALYEDGVVYYLEGPRSDVFCTDGEVNRAPHFAGERMAASAAGLGDQYSISMWIWNGMPVDGREVAGWFLSRGRDFRLDAFGEHLGVGGASGYAGRLIFLHGGDDDAGQLVAGETEIERWTWNHVLYVRDGETVRVYLNGSLEIETSASAERLTDLPRLFIGGRCDNRFNWEGRIDEVSLFDRALAADEAGQLAVD